MTQEQVRAVSEEERLRLVFKSLLLYKQWLRLAEALPHELFRASTKEKEHTTADALDGPD